VLIAAELLNNLKGGNGLMFGNISGVPPVKVVILGAGTVSEFATRAALGLGAQVQVFDNSITKLRCLQNNLGRQLNTSTVQPQTLMQSLSECDVAIGAVRGKNRSPVLVTEEMVQHMPKGSVIVDVSIDMGGCFETSELTTHDHPTFEKFGVTHYCVPNIPSRYARTASVSISNIFTPYLLQIAEEGGLEPSLRFNRGLKSGLYFYHGILTNKGVADWFNLPYSDANLLIF
jgi:alanine dehydrogenase